MQKKNNLFLKILSYFLIFGIGIGISFAIDHNYERDEGIYLSKKEILADISGVWNNMRLNNILTIDLTNDIPYFILNNNKILINNIEIINNTSIIINYTLTINKIIDNDNSFTIDTKDSDILIHYNYIRDLGEEITEIELLATDIRKADKEMQKADEELKNLLSKDKIIKSNGSLKICSFSSKNKLNIYNITLTQAINSQLEKEIEITQSLTKLRILDIAGLNKLIINFIKYENIEDNINCQLVEGIWHNTNGIMTGISFQIAIKQLFGKSEKEIIINNL